MAITDLLQQILSARYGRDVRKSIHDAIKTCYEDGKAGAIDLEAREALNSFKFKTEDETKKVFNPATQKWENFGSGEGGGLRPDGTTITENVDGTVSVSETITDNVDHLNKALNGFEFKTEDGEKKVYNPTTEAWEDFGGGQGASTWDEVANKPFETIGDGLKVEGNVLKTDIEPYELPIASTATLGGVKVDGTTTTIDADGTIHAIGGGSADLSIIADEWSNTKAYSANDYVLYNDKQYKCLLANSNIAPTNTTYWADTTVGNELTQLNNDLADLKGHKSVTIFTGAMLYIWGNLHVLNLFNASITNSSYIPSEYAPNTEVCSVVRVNDNTTTRTRMDAIVLTPAGKLTLQINAESNQSGIVRGQIVWFK